MTYNKLNEPEALKKTDNYLAEVRLTNVDFYSWVTTAANVHTTGTADQLTQARFYADSYASYHLPCVDSHISVYSIDSSNTVYLRCVALDIRTNNVYVNCRNNGTWTGWVLLSLNGHTHSYLPLSGGTMTGSLTGTTHGSSWISQVSAAVPIVITPAGVTDGGRYDAFIRGKFTDGSTWTFGIIEKAIDICYFAAGRTANGYDGRIKFDVVNGQVYAGGTALSKNGHTHSYLPLSGGTLTGALTFANNTWNQVGDDAAIGDRNYGSTFCVKGLGGDGHILLFNNSNAANFYVQRTPINNSDRIAYMAASGTSYLHVETWSHGAYGVSWWASDARMKDNIEESDVDALELVKNIKHRSFDMNGEHYPIGYVAQELEELDPKLVFKVPNSRNENGQQWFTGDYRYQIDPNKVIPYLSKAIQELSAENDELKRKNEELESRLEAIERKLEL